MPKQVPTLAPLQIFAIDWLLVGVGILWLLLLWLCGATNWQVVILGLGNLVWWGVGNFWKQTREKITHKSEFSLTQIAGPWGWWWALWLVTIFANLFTSQLPLQSAVVVFWWLMSGLWFWWWSGIVDQRLRNWLITHFLCGGLAIVVCLGWLVAWFHPRFLMTSSLSSSPNFLLPFFGHHHVAALIVLIWPLLWLLKQWWQFNQKTWITLMTGWIVLLGGTIWFSFSRSAWLAVVAQATIFFWLHRNIVKQNLKIWFLAGSIFVSLFVMGFLLKDLLQSQPFTSLPKPIRSLCYQWWAPDSLCSLAPEPRLEYWKQAVLVWRNFPWFGSGLDTFGQVAKRWQTNTLFQTQYPHQVFLQVLAEQGIVGFLVWSGFFGLLLLSFLQQLKQKILTKNWPIWLAIFGAVIIGNLDFDWQLTGFWWPFLMVVSGVVVPRQMRQLQSQRYIWVLNILLIIAFCGAVLSITTYFFLATNKADLWLKIWPLSSEWQSFSSQKIKHPQLWHEIVQQHYRNSPEVWFGAMTTVHDSAERWLWLEQLWQIDPWRYWETNPLVSARKNHDRAQIMLVLNRLEAWLVLYPQSKVQKHNPAFAAELFELADQSLKQEDWEVAGKALKLAQVFDPWVLHTHLPSLVGVQVAAEKIPFVVQVFASLNQQNYGDYLPQYRLWYRQLVTAEMNWLLQRRARLVGAEPISTQWLPLEKSVDLSDWVRLVKQLGNQSLVLLPDPQSRGDEVSTKLAGLVIEAGDATVGTDSYAVSEFYQLAQVIEPWIMDGKLWWFERMRFVKPTTQEFVQFSYDWSKGSARATGYKPQAWILFYNRVLLLSLRSGNFADAFASLTSIQHYWMQAQSSTKY